MPAFMPPLPPLPPPPPLRAVRLADGHQFFFRPLRADDAPHLVALYSRLSPETIRRRFLRPRPPTCDPAEAAALANVDQHERVAIAVVANPSPDAEIIAVGRFHTHPTGQAAELSLLVEDAFQHRGLGRLLLRALLGAARRRGLHALDGYTLYDNRPVLRLLRGADRPLQVAWHGGDVLEFRLDVARRPRAKREHQPPARVA